jgi:Tfp pilus assembly protein PilF
MIKGKASVKRALPWAVTLIGVMGLLAGVPVPVTAQSNSASPSQQQESADELLQLGIEQFRQYNLKEAEKTFQRVWHCGNNKKMYQDKPQP